MSMRNAFAAILIQGLALPVPPAQEEKRYPVPEEKAHKEALNLVREVFKEEYLKRSTLDRMALACKLLRQGIETQGGLAVQYVLLQEARTVAMDVGDLQTALRVVDELSRRFEVNALGLKCTTLATAGLASRSPEEFLAAANAVIDVAEEAIRVQEIDIAEKALSSALSLAKGAKNAALVAKVEARIMQLPTLKSRMVLFRKAREILTNDPDDPEANLLVGEQLCLVQEDWEKGLPFLAKGSNAALKALAEADLAAPNGVSEQTALGDGWWDRAQKEKGVERENLVLRAAVWYERTFREAQGLTRAKIEQRLSEAEGIRLAREGWIDVTNPSIFGLPPTPDRLIRVTVGAEFRPVELKNPPPGKYDGFSAQIRIAGKGQVKFYLDNKAHEIFLQNGSFWSYSIESPPPKKENFFIRGPKREVYRVRMILADGNYVVSLDGQESGKIKTKADRLEKFSMAFSDSEFTLSDVRLHKKQ